MCNLQQTTVFQSKTQAKVRLQYEKLLIKRKCWNGSSGYWSGWKRREWLKRDESAMNMNMESDEERKRGVEKEEAEWMQPPLIDSMCVVCVCQSHKQLHTCVVLCCVLPLFAFPQGKHKTRKKLILTQFRLFNLSVCLDIPYKQMLIIK